MMAQASPPAPLAGFGYGPQLAPVGNEWESPEQLSWNKEQPRSWSFPFDNAENARKLLPENSPYWMSLNGEWDFNWAPNPDSRPKEFFRPEFATQEWDKIKVPSNWNIEGIQPDGTLKYGVPIYVNQPVIFQHRVAVDDWRGGVMRTPPAHWTTFKHRNEVGSYRRSFEVPANWDGRELFVSFDGVDSFFYLWINGHYVGFSKNSRNTANFNITPYLKKGENVMAVEVYRNSDASYLEAQDMYRLPGIYRNVSLFSMPKLAIQNMEAIPDLDNNYANGALQITTDLRNLGAKATKEHKMVYTLYANKLYTQENAPVQGVEVSSSVATMDPNSQARQQTVVMQVAKPNQWSSEAPHCYTLVAELKDAKNRTVDVTSTIVGFRKVEICDTEAKEDEFGLAGRYYYVNGKPVKLKGVNRHESNPATGHYLTRETMLEEIKLLKRGNINHVRNSHYPTDPYFYFLCNLHGIYLEDEANIESHQYYYGEASLSHPKEWEKAHVARVMEMVHANINHPAIVIWSLGNEAGPGKNFVSAYDALKRVDLSRPVQYERNNDIVDMGSNQYPSIAWTREAVKGTYNIKYPFHISEYAHSMGNACGNLVDYWEAIESTNFFCGGAIWDWVDQSMYNYDPKTGKKYHAYGGDFGDTPNDGQFVLNGILFGDLAPKPQYYEVKKVYQYVGIKAISTDKGEFELFNKNYFTDLSIYDLHWELFEDGTSSQSGTLKMPTVAPRQKAVVNVPYQVTNLKATSEYFVKIQLRLKNKMPWADKGFVQAEEQIRIKSATHQPSLLQAAAQGSTLMIAGNGDLKTIKGENFETTFDLKKGTIHQLTYGTDQVIEPGKGPELNAMRAFVNNDNWFYTQWYERGLHNLKHNVVNQAIYTEKGINRVVLAFTVESQAPNAARITGGTSSGRNTIEELVERPFGENDFKFTTNQIWTIYPDGTIELQASIASNQPNATLPRLGYTMRLPQSFENFDYYGRGPVSNYADRKTGLFIEHYRSKVVEQFENFPKPQDMANHEDVRWCALTNKAGSGLLFIATDQLSATALPYSALDLTLASHPHSLPAVGDTYLNLDLGVTGLGGNSCGQGGPLTDDRVYARNHTMGFIIRPVQQSSQLVKRAAVEAAGELPISITRAPNGTLSISSLKRGAVLCYVIDKGKVQEVQGDIALRQGGTVTAWYKDTPQIKSSTSFARIERVAASVINASSQESGEGNASNLTDGDSNSIWHTMYSVTVAKYPHWVDLDAGEVKKLKGFTFLPRQNGSNGAIKAYSIQVSMDGKSWGEPVAAGSFDQTKGEKRILFTKPVQARYIRFTALSSHDGQDFAAAAEMGLLEE